MYISGIEQQFLVSLSIRSFLSYVRGFPWSWQGRLFLSRQGRVDYNVKQLGLMPKYTADQDFRLRVKKLSALAFVPVSDVVAVFESLATTFFIDELPIVA